MLRIVVAIALWLGEEVRSPLLGSETGFFDKISVEREGAIALLTVPENAIASTYSPRN